MAGTPENIRELKDSAARALAARDYRQALELYRTIAVAETQELRWIMKIAECLVALGNMNEALTSIRDAARGFANRGLELKAAAACRVALQLSPGDAETLALLKKLVGLHASQEVAAAPLPPPPAAVAASPAPRPQPRPAPPSAVPDAPEISLDAEDTVIEPLNVHRSLHPRRPTGAQGITDVEMGPAISASDPGYQDLTLDESVFFEPASDSRSGSARASGSSASVPVAPRDASGVLPRRTSAPSTTGDAGSTASSAGTRAAGPPPRGPSRPAMPAVSASPGPSGVSPPLPPRGEPPRRPSAPKQAAVQPEPTRAPAAPASPAPIARSSPILPAAPLRTASGTSQRSVAQAALLEPPSGSHGMRRATIDPSRLRGIPLLGPLPSSAVEAFARRSEYVVVAPGDRVINEGDAADAVYVVVSGDLVAVRGTPPRILARLGEGAFFGEMALLDETPRSASVVAVTDVELLVLPRRLILEICERFPSVLSSLMQALRTRLIATLTATSPLFAAVPFAERKLVVSRFKVREIDADTVFIHEGQRVDGLYVILTGRADVTLGDAPVATLTTGDVAGEMSLLARGTAQASVRTRTRVSALMLPASDVAEVFMVHPQVLDHLATLSETRREQLEVVRAQLVGAGRSVRRV